MPFRGPVTPGLNGLLTDFNICPSFFKEWQWPHYNLDNKLKWTSNGAFDLHVLWELTNSRQCSGKWKEFPYILVFYCLSFNSQSYNLTFHDIYMILSNNLLSEESR